MVTYTSSYTADQMVEFWPGLDQFKLDVDGVAQAFAWTYGHDDFTYAYGALPSHDAISYDSQAGCWREFNSGMGWIVKGSILPEMGDIIAAMCALQAIVSTMPPDEKPPKETDPPKEPPTPEEVLEKRRDRAEKVDKEYRKLRLRHLGSTAIKACKIAQALLAVERWNPDDERIGLPDGEVLHMTPHTPGYTVRKEDEVPGDYLTRHMAVAPGLPSPMWERFVLDLASGDREMASALQIWTSAALMVGNPEHRTHILFGDGATGKSTFLKVVMHAMGDYAGTARASLFTDEGSFHSAEQLPFVNARLVILPELPRGALRSDLLKTVSGGDAISVRGMRENPRTETPTATLFFSANELPEIRLVDEALKRRLLVWPFDHKPDKIDVQLGSKLVSEDELPGVVAWLVEGLTEVIRLRTAGEPLPIPAKVAATSEEYFHDVDDIGVWRDACIEEGGETANKELYASFKRYCATVGVFPLSSRSFGLKMTRLYPDKRRDTKGIIYPVTIK